MADDLKTRVLELAEIAKACPDNLQEKCFELLLQDLLRSQSGRGRSASTERLVEAASTSRLLTNCRTMKRVRTKATS